ncbi:MAG: hypothetical protein L0241_14235 [Planctomycetia bacterium]|nr:hypothetical protein [Planctomycetia bacterium]
MAADWKDWRPIVVNGERFRWQDDRCGSVLVRPETNPVRLLVVSPARNETPGLMRVWIEMAIANGWLTDIPQMQLLGVDGSRCPPEAVPFIPPTDSAETGTA